MNDLSPVRRQAIMWTNADLFFIGLLENWNWNSIIFILENAFENVVYQNGGHFVPGEMSL